MKKLFIIGIAALLLVAFTMPAMAKVKIGGIIFTDFYYLDRDKDNSRSMGLGADPYQVTTIQVPNITRLNARWTNEDNVGMFIELGIGQTGGGIDPANTTHEQSDGVKLRHAYGWWDVNPAFQILAGKTTTPFSPLNPSQMLGTRSGSLNIIGVGYGNYYSGRFAQVRGTFKFGKIGRVAVALVDPNGAVRLQGAQLGYQAYFPYNTSGAGGELGKNYQNNTKIPRIDISVPLYFGPVAIFPSFYYQYRSVDAISPPAAGYPDMSRYDNSLDSYAGSLGIKGGFGAFAISAEGQWGKNWSNSRSLIGTSGPAAISAAQLNPVSGEVNNATTYAYWIDASYKIGVVTPHVMFGQMNTDVDAYADPFKTGVSQQKSLNATSSFWGFSVPIALAKGFQVRPELMWYDDGDVQWGGNDIAKLGSYAIYGVQFQITF